jgi:hypothetical protein
MGIGKHIIPMESSNQRETEHYFYWIPRGSFIERMDR